MLRPHRSLTLIPNSGDFLNRVGLKVNMEQNSSTSNILNYDSEAVLIKLEELLVERSTAESKIKTLYGFVASLPLGYNRNDDIAASEVLRDGYGQCNTKVTLLCALARGAGVPSRIHAYELHKEAQRRRAPAWLVFFMPRTTMFVWPEFYLNKKWIPLQKIVATKPRAWDSCPFDGAKYQLEPLPKEWIARDLGVWNTPDELYAMHKPSVNGWRTIGWVLIGRRVMNSVVRKSAC